MLDSILSKWPHNINAIFILEQNNLSNWTQSHTSQRNNLDQLSDDPLYSSLRESERDSETSEGV